MEKNQFAEQVFETVCGFLVKEACIPGVENLFAPGKPCDLLYQEMAGARERLAQRTGLEEDDTDIEGIIRPLLKISGTIGVRMYEYGAEFAAKEEKM